MRGIGTRAWLCPLGASLLWMGVASCDSPSDPRPSVVVTVSPSGLVALNVGDTLTVRATVENAATPAVRFTSSDRSIAEVGESTGLVRAVSVGEATITATTVQTPSASASVQFRVQDRPSTVLIEEIRDSAGALVDPARARGTIHVHLEVEVGSAAALEVLIDTVVACRQSFETATTAPTAAAAALAPTTCSVTTTEFHPDGRPKYPNGSTQVHARLVGADGGVRHQARGFPITLANANTMVTRIFAQRDASDAAGLKWAGGNLTFTTLPVMYDRDVTLTRVEYTYQTPGGRTFVRTDTSAPFSAVIEEDSLVDVIDPDLRVTVRTSASTGESGPSSVVGGEARYDNRAPLPGTVRPREWMGAEVGFVSTYVPADNADESGVGGVVARFYAGDPVLSDSALVARGATAQVTVGGDLRTAGVGAYKVAVEVCDALLNCRIREGFPFGVDLAAPTVEDPGVRDRALNPTGSLDVRIRDDLSGFDARPIEAVVLSLDADPSTATCGPLVDGIDLPGRQVGGSCAPDSVGTRIPLPGAAGYYTYTLTAFDRAGNRAAAVVRRVLRDNRAPSVVGVVLPTQGLPGDELSFSASATDSLDLTDLVFRLGFPAAAGSGRIALPFDTASTAVGAAFDATLTTQSTRTARFPVVRTLTTVIGANRATVLVDSVHVEAVDAAMQTDVSSRPLSPNAYGGNPSTNDPYTAITSVSFGAAPTSICAAGCQTNEPTSAGLELRIAGPSGGLPTTPFSRVYFYRRDHATSRVTLVGSISGGSAQGDIGGGQAVYRYSFTYSARGAQSAPSSFFAVGVSSAANALRSEEKAIQINER